MKRSNMEDVICIALGLVAIAICALVVSLCAIAIHALFMKAW